MTTSFYRTALILGLLSLIGPFAIDMYIPALPAIALDLRAPVSAVQLTLTTYFAGYGICQIFYGPVTDMVGRKPPLYFGLTLYIAASVGCALAPTVEWLAAFRFFQAIGAASVMVVPRAVIRDLHTGVEATRLMSMIMLVISVSPILAPLLGSFLIVPFGWRSVFFAVALAAALSLVLVALALPETLPPEKRQRIAIASVLSGYGQLLRHRRFLGLTFIGMFGFGGFFAFIASASFIYVEHFGLTPMQFGLAFAVNAIGFIGASQLSAPLASRVGFGRMILGAVTFHALGACALFATTAAGIDNFAVLSTLIFITFMGLGLVIPATMVLALEEHGPIAGMASALGGTLQMVSGAVLIVIVGLFFNGTPLPMVTAILVCALAALGLSWLTLGRDPPIVVPA